MWRVWQGLVFIAMSLDGYIARTDGDVGWLTDPPRLDRKHEPGMGSRAALDWNTFFPSVDHIVLGRGTYDKARQGTWPYADKTVLVLSRTLAAQDRRIHVVRSVDEAVHLLNQRFARRVHVDGGQVVQTFLRRGLVDELTIAIAPVLLGGGIPLFATSDRDVHLELRATHGSEDGMVHATYRVLNP